MVVLLGCGPREQPFLWGSATAAYQVEGGIHSADWSEWERLGNIQNGDRADDGPRMTEHYEADLDEAVAMGHNSYRFSLEWARLQPRDGPYDGEALAYYRKVVKACRDRKLEPMVTLSHFTLPAWVHDVNPGNLSYGELPEPKGWEGGGGAPGTGPVVTQFAQFAADMADEFGDEVDLWTPLNEPLVQLTATFLNPAAAANERFPRAPGGPRPDLTPAMHALTNFIYAHARATDAIRDHDTIDADGDGKATQIGIAQHMRFMVPGSQQADYVVAAGRAEYAFNFLLLDALTKGDLDYTLDGKFTAPFEGQGFNDLRNRLDFIGVNYYSRSEVLPITFTAKEPYRDEEFSLRMISGETTSFGGPVSDLGWDQFPDGFYEVLLRTHARYALPIYVTENGIADATNTKRAAFIAHHLRAMQRARDEGADIRGYLHWSLLDNFEWVRGFSPRFGLLTVDYADPERKRTRTAGAELYSRIIADEGKVSDELLAENPLR